MCSCWGHSGDMRGLAAGFGASAQPEPGRAVVTLWSMSSAMVVITDCQHARVYYSYRESRAAARRAR